MKIGSTINKLRKDKKKTQEEFAKEVGISPTSLSQIESGKKRPNPSTLKCICKELGISELHLYLLSFDESDVPEHKRELYKQLREPLRVLVESLT
jgi:transcriptional regulator with XRE-family HTH domain